MLPQVCLLLLATSSCLRLHDVRLYANATITDAIFTLEQTFATQTHGSGDAVYYLPLPPSASLFFLEARYDGKVISTSVMAKAEAQKVYDKAHAEGKTALLAKEHDVGAIQLFLANLPPNAFVTITAKVLADTQKRDADLRISFPFAMTPRYKDPTTDVWVPAVQGVHITVEWKAMNLSFSKDVASLFTGEFYVDIANVFDGDQFARASVSKSGSLYYTLVEYVPRKASASNGDARNPFTKPHIMIDASWSMTDLLQNTKQTRMDLAKALGKELLKTFPTASVSKFDHIRNPILRDEIDRIEPRGGTEIFGSLNDAMLHHQPDIVFVITDADYSSMQGDHLRALALERARQQGVTVVTLAVGDSNAKAVAEQIALQFQGICEFVTGMSDVSSSISRVIAAVNGGEPKKFDIHYDMNPIAMREPKFVWPGYPVYAVYISTKPSTALIVDGYYVSVVEAPNTNRRVVRRLLEVAHEIKTVDMTALAVDAGIVTSLTSLVGSSDAPVPRFYSDNSVNLQAGIGYLTGVSPQITPQAEANPPRTNSKILADLLGYGVGQEPDAIVQPLASQNTVRINHVEHANYKFAQPKDALLIFGKRINDELEDMKRSSPLQTRWITFMQQTLKTDMSELEKHPRWHYLREVLATTLASIVPYLPPYYVVHPTTDSFIVKICETKDEICDFFGKDRFEAPVCLNYLHADSPAQRNAFLMAACSTLQYGRNLFLQMQDLESPHMLVEIKTAVHKFVALGWTRQVPLPNMEFNATATELFRLAVSESKTILQLIEKRADVDEEWRPIAQLLKAQESIMAEMGWQYTRRWNLESLIFENVTGLFALCLIVLSAFYFFNPAL